MHDASLVEQMRHDAVSRGWEDTARLLQRMGDEARAEEKGALLYYHLGELQRALIAEGLDLPPLSQLMALLHGACACLRP